MDLFDGELATEHLREFPSPHAADADAVQDVVKLGREVAKARFQKPRTEGLTRKPRERGGKGDAEGDGYCFVVKGQCFSCSVVLVVLVDNLRIIIV